MNYTFSQTQLDDIKALYKTANDRVDALGSANTNYADVYAYIRDQLHFETDLSVDKVARWFTAATDANAGIGAVSALIRSYTQYQGELRGVPITDQMIQFASNKVAVNVIDAITSNNGVLPTIEQIAHHDASGVGDTLFKSTIPTDSAYTNNAAWAGSVLFPGLGSDQTGNLLGGDGALNTVGDLKDILFAYDATIKGLNAANASFGGSGLMMLESYLNFGPVNSITSMVYSGIAIFGNTLVLPYEEMVFNLTPEKFLDTLRKIADPNAAQDTVSGDFVQRANELFYGSAGLASNLQVQLLDQFSPSGLAALAQTDLAYRYALLELNPFAVLGVDYTAQNANGELNLYDPATGQGELTEQWLADRARFAVLNAQAVQTLEPNLFQSFDYFEDVATQTTIGIPVFTSKYIFGGSNSDSIDGGLNNDHLYGLTGNDTLTGNEGDDYLEGGYGNDTLNGGDGQDTMLGGSGNDTYIVDNIGDEVIESVDEGTDDTVQSSITYTLGENVEKLILTETDTLNGTGNTLNNTLTGNNAANTLDGGTGADILVGGAGDDVYIVDNIGDEVIESANEGTDTVRSSITYTLSENIEKLILTGTVAVDATGNELNNTLTGNNAANILVGGAGQDTLIGGEGNDTLIGNDGNGYLEGGQGNDNLNGGTGYDTYYAGAGDTLSKKGGRSPITQSNYEITLM